MNPIAEDILMHYGMPRRSGRYPWGSGEDPYQRSRDLLGRYDELKKQGLKESEIAAELGYFDKRTGLPSATKLRAAKSNAKNIRDIYRIETAKSLRKDGLGPTEIGRRMGVPEGTVRGWFDAEFEGRARAASETALHIQKQVDKKGMVDIGVGVERELGISKERLNQALLMLEESGYPIYKAGIPQKLNPGQQTNERVICVPGTPYKAIYEHDKVHPLNEDKYVSHDSGDTFDRKFTYPTSLDSKRLMIRYADDPTPDGYTGNDKDGIIELRRGVQDLSLGNDRYSQVRIMVDGDRYLKGMAVYSDNMPDGVDVVFNTNKTRDIPMRDVLKKITNDPDNPFGSLIKDADQGGQYWYNDSKTGERKLGLINKRAAEGDWDDWADALPSQFLGKQSRYMAKKQLDLAKADRVAEFENICELTNPTIKKYLLEEFANKCDAAAVDLKAAALPGQKYHVIVPVNTLKDNEVYAPGYKDGTEVALIRYPHAGTFEIPILKVNNKHAPAEKIIGADSVDAVCINKKNADRLSGADFDGDTVMVIPTNDPKTKVKIISTDPLPGLVGFDPKIEYAHQEGRPVISKTHMQRQMGVVSNLITDMTLAGASDAEKAAAVRHSMVVIDSYKHKLDYKRSEVENNIAALKVKYQPKFDEDGNPTGKGGGASTILSRAKNKYEVPKRQGSPYTNLKGKPGYDPSRPEGALIYKVSDDLYRPVKTVNKKTGVVTLVSVDGEKIRYNPDNETERNMYTPVKIKDKDTGEVSYRSKNGKITYKLEARTQDSTQMAETDDAYSLVSDARHPMELIYAEYANSMKALANRARKEIATAGKIEYSKTAKASYQEEVTSLMNKLDTALQNAPREREVQRRVAATVAKYEAENKDASAEDIRKTASRAQTKAREEVGAVSRKKRNIEITDREWEAIQAGAISEQKLKDILANTDVDKLKQRAMPRASTTLSTSQISRMKALAASGYTLMQIAEKMGKSTSTVSKYLKGVK